jgi:hypothetical protein
VPAALPLFPPAVFLHDNFARATGETPMMVVTDKRVYAVAEEDSDEE